MCTYFKTETYVSQNLIDYFFLTLTVRRPFYRKGFNWRGYGSMGLLSEETEALHTELTKRAEAAFSSYFAAVDFLQYIYLVLVAKYH